MMTMSEIIGFLVALLMFLPIIGFATFRLSSLGYFRSRQEFEEGRLKSYEQQVKKATEDPATGVS